MMQEAAIPLGIELRALVEAEDGSAGEAIPYSTVGHAEDRDAIVEFVGQNVVTVEHEHIPDEILHEIGSRPSADALRFAQDKLIMRTAWMLRTRSGGKPTAPRKSMRLLPSSAEQQSRRHRPTDTTARVSPS